VFFFFWCVVCFIVSVVGVVGMSAIDFCT